MRAINKVVIAVAVILLLMGYVGVIYSHSDSVKERLTQAENLRVIDSLALELERANRGSYMVASRMYGDTIYLPVSSQEDIDSLVIKIRQYAKPSN